MTAKETWWFWRPVQERLVAFGQALLAPLGQKYRIVIKPGQSFCSPDRRLIQIDPASFPDEPPRIQFDATQGVMVHETGHALYSGAWADQRADVLCRMANILEDERVERAMRRFYPGVAGVLDLRCKLRLAQSLEKAEPLPPEWEAFEACLVWRWAKRRRLSQKKMLAALKFETAGTKLWRKIRKLVERAWDAPDTARVIELAGRILEILGIPPETPRLPFDLLMGDDATGIPRLRTDAPLPLPDEPCKDRQPAPFQPDDGVDQEAGGDIALQPAPYAELERDARPLATQLSEALKLPEPDTRPEPSEWRGRYSLRQELRTPDTPCLCTELPDPTARSLALYGLVDRSGSMDSAEEEVRLALMTLYLAATDLQVPVGLAAFGADGDGNEVWLTCPIAPLSPQADETVKALIAGYSGETNAEYLDWGLRLAERELAARRERCKVLVVIHDGQPVYSGRRGNDWALSQAHVLALTQRGVIVIGLYLGDDEDDVERLGQLFPSLIVTTPPQLPERLGDLLRALL